MRGDRHRSFPGTQAAQDAANTAVICCLSSRPSISTLFDPCLSIVHDETGTTYVDSCWIPVQHKVRWDFFNRNCCFDVG